MLAGPERDERAIAPSRRRARPPTAPAQPEHEALDEKLLHEPPASGADRGPNRDFASAARSRARAAGSRR